MLGRSCGYVAVDKLQSEEYLCEVVALVSCIGAFSSNPAGASWPVLLWGICDAHNWTACVSSERLAIPPEALGVADYCLTQVGSGVSQSRSKADANRFMLY